MKEKLVVLIDLQALEAEMAHVQSALQQIPGTLEALDAGFMELQAGLSEKTTFISEIKKEYRAKEAEEQMNLSRIKKSRERMDSVKTNKEYQSLLKEIQDIEEKNSLLEDEMLAGLDRMENGEKTVLKLKEEMALMEKKVTDQKAIVTRKAEALKQRQAELEQQLEVRIKAVDAEILKIYNSVKLRVGAIAIVPVHNAVCKGCHLNMPPQMYNELHRQDSLKFCPHCHRMIYWAAEES
ncbi:MAG: C4-type zinc ribbon domain-containing protein [Pseudomonadota bacterium]